MIEPTQYPLQAFTREALQRLATAMREIHDFTEPTDSECYFCHAQGGYKVNKHGDSVHESVAHLEGCPRHTVEAFIKKYG